MILICISLILGAFGAWLIARLGDRLGMVDLPNERSSHMHPIPKGGGIGILAAFILSSILLHIPVGFWLSAAMLALVSLYGDRSELSPRFRLLVQVVAAIGVLGSCVVYGYSFWVPTFVFPGFKVFLGLWSLFLVVFIVGTANFYNFMDGINGIAGITGVVGFALLAIFAVHYSKDSTDVMLAICMSVSCLGFLPFNMPNAKVFMGDVGSILIGFVFAAMVVLLSKSLRDFICLTAFIFPFYADEITTMLVRIKDGEKLTQPHRRHLYQLLANEYGISHWKVSMGYGLTQLFVGLSILWFRGLGNISMISALLVYFCAFVILTYMVRKKLVAAT